MKINPEHSGILTDYATIFLAAYYETGNNADLIQAKEYLEKSLKADNKNSDTIYKLSIVSMYLSECEKAKNYLKSAKKFKNPNVTLAFEMELSAKCE